MATLELVPFESGETSLMPTRFEVREAMNLPFVATVWALSPRCDIELGSIVGQAAVLRIAGGQAHVRQLGARSFGGMCSAMELVQAEPRGASTYRLRLVPWLWRLCQRRNQRIFQRLSVPEIVRRLLEEWRIAHRWEIDEAAYPRFEYRVQYAESDYDFVDRLLREAGISYYFEDPAPGQARPPATAPVAPLPASVLVLSDRAHRHALRPGGPIPHVDRPSEAAQQEFVTAVRLSQDFRPGRLSIRDFDFRLRPDYQLFADAPAAGEPEQRCEQYRYQPGALRIATPPGPSPTPAADDKAVVRSDEPFGAERARRALGAARFERRRVRCATNAPDLRPGVVFAMRHPRSDLDGRGLLVSDLAVSGTRQGEWEMEVTASFADEPLRPPQPPTRPRAYGLESAIVVGPPGEEIHTDEHGRVRVQFHWDREGGRDDESSCWMRVSQGWAGGRYGMLCLPRVGQEVLVGFEEGDPDRPLVMGRTGNATSPTPYRLPEHKTISVWKSDSSPHSGGYNAIALEDAAGREVVFVQAERDYAQLVKRDETRVTRGKLCRTVVQDADLVVEQSKRERVQGDSHLDVGPIGRELVDGSYHTIVGGERHQQVGQNAAFEAGTEIHIKAGRTLVLEAGSGLTIKCGSNFVDIHPEGLDIKGKEVRLNSGGTQGAGSGAAPATAAEAQEAEVTVPAMGWHRIELKAT
ncbi:MAG: type VI secretion system tip protein VgrG [Deltaproteobacteria bacterium]|nr:type VI secretion system tip protein VgrG [Deltaproteobacteria bacterium]